MPSSVEQKLNQWTVAMANNAHHGKKAPVLNKPDGWVHFRAFCMLSSMVYALLSLALASPALLCWYGSVPYIISSLFFSALANLGPFMWVQARYFRYQEEAGQVFIQDYGNGELFLLFSLIGTSLLVYGARYSDYLIWASIIYTSFSVAISGKLMEQHLARMTDNQAKLDATFFLVLKRIAMTMLAVLVIFSPLVTGARSFVTFTDGINNSTLLVSSCVYQHATMSTTLGNCTVTVTPDRSVTIGDSVQFAYAAVSSNGTECLTNITVAYSCVCESSGSSVCQ
jgi:hypothetical protein